MFQKGNQFAKGIGRGGRKTARQEFLVKTEIDKYSPIFWQKLGQMLKSQVLSERKWAMQEFNKLQIKRMPTEVSGVDGSAIKVNIFRGEIGDEVKEESQGDK